MSLLDKKEDVRIEKSNGQVVGPYKALFTGGAIIIADPMADIEAGDTILRKLPNGRDERNIAESATFIDRGIGSLGAHYLVNFRKDGGSVMQKPTQHISITGAQSVQIGDYNTQNIINSFEALVRKIETSSATSAEKEEAMSRLRALLMHPIVVSVLGSVAGAVVG